MWSLKKCEAIKTETPSNMEKSCSVHYLRVSEKSLNIDTNGKNIRIKNYKNTWLDNNYKENQIDN